VEPRLRCHGRAAHCRATTQAADATAAGQGQLPSVPTGEASAPSATALPPADGSAAAPAAASGPTPRVRVITDVLDLDISLQGGDLVRADLPKYPRDKKPGSPPVRLLGTQEPDFSVTRTGLRALNGRAEPTHLATYTSAADEYRLAPGAEELRVPITWTDGQGVTVTKTYVFKPGRYDIEVVYERRQPVGRAVVGRFVCAARPAHLLAGALDVRRRELRLPRPRDLRRQQVPQARHHRQRTRASFAQNVTNGWIATMQHHFVSAAVPPAGEDYHFTLGQDGDHALLTYRGPLKAVPAGTTGRFTETLFVGPKLQAQLETVGPRLELTADYGKLTILSQPLFWLLEKVYGFVGNWGWAIIIVTFLLKLLFYKLTETSGARWPRCAPSRRASRASRSATRTTASSSPSR